MFFHHEMFNPHHHRTRELETGMQLASAFIVEQELEESRERCDRDCDNCRRSSTCRKEEAGR